MNHPFYDKNAQTRKILSGFLPHWHQDGKLQFVTIRLADSLPQSKIEDLLELKKQFLANNPQPWDNSTQKEYWNLIGHIEAKYLDKGYGACILRNHKVRKDSDRDSEAYGQQSISVNRLCNNAQSRTYAFASNRKR